MLDRSTPPQVYMMGDLKLPKPKKLMLSNGIELNYFSGGSQDVNMLSLIWSGGSNEAPKPNIAKLMGNMMREGTESMSGAQISEALDFNGAMLRISTDGHVSSVNLSSLNSKTVHVLPVLHDIITAPTFPEQTFEMYREIDAREFMLSQTKVMVLCSQLLSKMIRGADHPQAQMPTVQGIESISVGDVRHFYDSVVTATGCKAFLSGNVTTPILDEIKSMLESLPVNGPAMPQLIVPFHPQDPGYQETLLPGAVQAAVSVAIPAPARNHPDYLPLRFAVIALGGYFGSRLMKNIREDKGYTYGIEAYLVGSKEGSYIMISAQTDSKYVDAVITEISAELKRMASVPLTTDEMIRLRQFISSSLMETLDSPFSIMDYYKIIDTVGLPKGYFEDQVRLVHEIDAQTIAEMSRKYMLIDQMRIAVCR